MAENAEYLETADAMQFANLRLADWNNALQRGLYKAPEPESGRPRRFDAADLTAAYVLGQLYERQVKPAFACAIAVDVLRAIRRDPDVATLSAWRCMKAGKPTVAVAQTAPRPGDVELFKFHVAKIRHEAIAGIRRKAAKT